MKQLDVVISIFVGLLTPYPAIVNAPPPGKYTAVFDPDGAFVTREAPP
jgi:hypothetical protein